jgi:cell division transport system permease protein
MQYSRRIHTLQRIFKSGFINLFRNAWLTIAATAVMVVALTIISIAFVLNVTANNAIDVLAKDLKANVYIANDISEVQLQTLKSGLQNLDFVDSVDYITQEQAREDLAGDFKQEDGIAQALALAGEDVLPASFRISVNDLKRMPEIQTFADSEEYSQLIDSVSLGQSDAQDTIDKAASAQRFINTGSIVAAITLSAVSIMIIFNTIRMAIYTRRDEIRIMKLIGATPDYIRGPFLVEASLYGVFAGIIAHIGVYSLVVSIGKKVAEQREFAATYDYLTSPWIVSAMLLSVVLIGIFIGLLSSMLAMERHLKLKNW